MAVANFGLGRHIISVPWGLSGALELELPPKGPFSTSDIAIIWPDLRHAPADYPQALEQAIDSPIGAGKLEQHLRPGTKVAIVIDDPSRWTPIREALPIVLRRIHLLGVEPTDVTISVGVGRHHVVDADAMQQRVGHAIAAGYRWHSPPLDDLSAYVDLGSTSQGVPVRVFRPVVEADLRILIGSVLPHLQAGFGGGYKLILPGTSHRTTLGALHRQGLVGSSDTTRLLGSAATENPMRQAIQEAARLLGPCWSISHLIGRPSEVLRIVAGDPQQVQDVLAAEVCERLRAPDSLPADMVIAGNYPWPGDPMQSFKVLLQHRAACRPGGVLVGLFWTDPNEITRSFPISALRLITATGRFGGWVIRWLLPVAHQVGAACGSSAAFMLRWACELVVDRTVLIYSPILRERLGPHLGPILLFADLGALWDAAASVLIRQRRNARSFSIKVFPQGGLTYVTQPKACDQ
jgi:hypothetical protein